MTNSPENFFGFVLCPSKKAELFEMVENHYEDDYTVAHDPSCTPCEEWDEDDGYEDQWDEDDGQPTMYEEYQDLYGGDDWDHGQYDEF